MKNIMKKLLSAVLVAVLALSMVPMQTARAEETASQSEEDVVYTVKKGDSLSSIATNYYGNNANRNRLKKYNEDAFAKTNGKLVVGMELLIPASLGGQDRIAEIVLAEGETVYTVKSGDTLWKIAKELLGNGKYYKEIFARNSDRLVKASEIYSGQNIAIPNLKTETGGTATPKPEPTATPAPTPTDTPEPTETPTAGSATDASAFEYEKEDDGTIRITGLKDNTLEVVVIPETIDGAPVTSIGDEAFRDCSNLTSIEIPEGVTSIGDWAFADCSSLTSIKIPGSVDYIGVAAALGCRSLETIIAPKGSYAVEWAIDYFGSDVDVQTY